MKKHPIQSIVSGVVLLIIIVVGIQRLATYRFYIYKTFVQQPQCVEKKEGFISLNVSNTICFVNFNDERTNVKSNGNLKMIYYVTPTYPRPEQAPELTRLAHTLMHVPRLHWIVADDQPLCSDLVATILRRSKIPLTHIASPKPYTVKCKKNNARGVANRRAALAWLISNKMEGIVYFGDDDNAVDLLLFDEIRKTKGVSMFPVGLITRYGVSSPIVNDGKVFAFFDSWSGRRKFPVDMAGFAVNTRLLSWSAIMPYQAGLEEDKFLQNLGLKIEDIEPLADNCSKVLVWHTRTKKFPPSRFNMNFDERSIIILQKYQNVIKLLNEVSRLGIAKPDPEHGAAFIIRKNSSTFGTLLSVKREVGIVRTGPYKKRKRYFLF